MFRPPHARHRHFQNLQQDCDIYALRDPATHEVRYVGKSVNLRRRLRNHRRTRILPGFRAEILEHCPHREILEAEAAWIAYFEGPRMLNTQYRTKT